VAHGLLRPRRHDVPDTGLRSPQRRGGVRARADPSRARRGGAPRPGPRGGLSVTRFAAVVGAVTAPGRLNQAIAYAAEQAAARPGVSATLVNLADPRISFADGRPLDRFTDDTARVVGALSEADAVLIASPVYRGSFTGALKNLLDLAPVDAL